MATMDDIARNLGVSKSTVSKALSGADDVSAAMRRAVLEKAVELGYTKVSRNSEAPRIAIFITNMAYKKPDDFGFDIVMGFRKAAEPAGFHVEIIPLDIPMQQKIRYDEFMVLENYRGGLFLGLSLRDPWLKDFETCRTPAVLYDNHVKGNAMVTYVGVDNMEGMELAVEYLISLGHKKIGYLSGGLEAYVYKKRCNAFFEILERNNLPHGQELMGNHYHCTQCMEENMPRLLELGCTAFVCSHDLMARTAIKFCVEKGYDVPGQISIMGYDDGPLCEGTTPPLTSIRQNRTELGKSAFYALSSQINKVPISTLLLHAELIKRESCAKVPETK